MRYRELLSRLARLVSEAGAVARRRRESRVPRARIRVAHGEAKVLPEGAPERERMLSLAAELVSEYGGRGREP